MKGIEVKNWMFVAIGAVAILILFNQYMLFSISSSLGGTGFKLSGPTADKTSEAIKVSASGDVVKEVMAVLIPKGVPKDYGQEVGVSFDDPVPSLTKIANLDYQLSTDSLNAEQRQRYIDVTTKISCEFCCSAPAVTDTQGRDLCGCSHAAAFRGVTKYLVVNHPDWTNDEILWELTKWKSIFYPRNMVQKGVALAQAGLELTPAALNDRNLLEKLNSDNIDAVGLPDAQMVGGC